MAPQIQPFSTKDLVDIVLFSSTAGQRELQSSPILGDVWLEYAEAPAKRVDLLITPQFGIPAGPLAKEISSRLGGQSPRKGKTPRRRTEKDLSPNVAYLQGLIAARLTFSEVIGNILPMTNWWHDRITQWKHRQSTDTRLTELDTTELIKDFVKWATTKKEDERRKARKSLASLPEFLRMMVLGVLILWGEEKTGDRERSREDAGILGLLKLKNAADELGKRLSQALAKLPGGGAKTKRSTDEADTSHEWAVCLDKQIPWVFQISLNREVSPALRESVAAVKGDAARHLFEVRCDKIVWAILDSGIDGRHPAFHRPLTSSVERSGSGDTDRGPKTGCRIIKALDFGYIREILSIDADFEDERKLNDKIDTILGRRGIARDNQEKRDEVRQRLQLLIDDSRNDRPLLWQVVEELIAVDPEHNPPVTDHGTHVAGILAADPNGVRIVDPKDSQRNVGQDPQRAQQGLCPEIELYDLRVLGESEIETEFAVIAALQYIRHLNERLGFLRIHGANLSLQMRHNVRNWACGQTPVCIECDKLVNSGVVVVAAAGNFGYQRLQTDHGMYDGYVPLSITDPGNADGVITVGATHRFWPHTYGVSFFSSRGPTGDGRLKPDLVAPGERITSCLKLEDEDRPHWGEMDGTSMAAPHVSGAAAMLMARYSEMKGRPRVIKEVLCSTATDLARERSFQGHGMLDILRALQKR